MKLANLPWPVWALASAGFAALTAIFGKLGVGQVDSNLATLIRVIVLLPLVAVLATLAGGWREVGAIPTRSWVFLVVSGLATGASWLCYYRALQQGPASGVATLDKLSIVIVAVIAALFLGERLAPRNWLGVALIVVGAVLASLR